MIIKERWERGDKAKLARTVGTSRQRVSDYTHGRRSAPYPLAKTLVAAAACLGYETTMDDWLAPMCSENPLFIHS